MPFHAQSIKTGFGRNLRAILSPAERIGAKQTIAVSLKLFKSIQKLYPLRKNNFQSLFFSNK